MLRLGLFIMLICAGHGYGETVVFSNPELQLASVIGKNCPQHFVTAMQNATKISSAKLVREVGLETYTIITSITKYSGPMNNLQSHDVPQAELVIEREMCLPMRLDAPPEWTIKCSVKHLTDI